MSLVAVAVTFAVADVARRRGIGRLWGAWIGVGLLVGGVLANGVSQFIWSRGVPDFIHFYSLSPDVWDVADFAIWWGLVGGVIVDRRGRADRVRPRPPATARAARGAVLSDTAPTIDAVRRRRSSDPYRLSMRERIVEASPPWRRRRRRRARGPAVALAIAGYALSVGGGASEREGARLGVGRTGRGRGPRSRLVCERLSARAVPPQRRPVDRVRHEAGLRVLPPAHARDEAPGAAASAPAGPTRTAQPPRGHPEVGAPAVARL